MNYADKTFAAILVISLIALAIRICDSVPPRLRENPSVPDSSHTRLAESAKNVPNQEQRTPPQQEAP